jgi:hypothetical protein
MSRPSGLSKRIADMSKGNKWLKYEQEKKKLREEERRRGCRFTDAEWQKRIDEICEKLKL